MNGEHVDVLLPKLQENIVTSADSHGDVPIVAISAPADVSYSTRDAVSGAASSLISPNSEFAP